MSNQRWKTDPTLHSCPRIKDRIQETKDMDYHGTYKHEFLESDPIRDWESIERCIKLWKWSLDRINITDISEMEVLDIGTKDGQFPEYLKDKVKNVIGLEISEKYVKYAQSKNRPVIYGDVSSLEYKEKWDYVFSHHVLGLTPDYGLSLKNMWKAVRSGGYMITLNDCPGNKRKHFSYIEDDTIFNNFNYHHHHEIKEIIYQGHWNSSLPKEYVYFIKKR